MKYYEVTITITPYSADAADLLAALSAEAGFETFEQTPDGLKAYVQQALFDRQALDDCITDFPFAGTHIIYKVNEAEDRDWNEQWEQQGFSPIVVADRLLIHDGRHLNENEDENKKLSKLNFPLSIEIDAHMAFGTGTHETTRMICATLLDMDLHGKRVLDCGCGTGILSICALLAGAQECTAYDIDEWSVDNTRHNAVINHVDQHLHTLHGDATLLDDITGAFDLIMANINRNILLQDMPRFVSKMNAGALLVLSGFYESDSPMLTAKAQSLGLQPLSSTSDAQWACLLFRYLGHNGNEMT